MTEIIENSKQNLRKYFLCLRKNYTDDYKSRIAENIKNNFVSLLSTLQPYNYIACYYAKENELSTQELINHPKFNNKILLPKVIEEERILHFKKYLGITSLIKGAFDLLEPLDSCPTLVPDIVIAPCLAVDLYGNRLGYGGGYYDATIKDLRNKKHILYIGFCSSKQILENIPFREHDQKLDYLINENEIIKF